VEGLYLCDNDLCESECVVVVVADGDECVNRTGMKEVGASSAVCTMASAGEEGEEGGGDTQEADDVDDKTLDEDKAFDDCSRADADADADADEITESIGGAREEASFFR